MSHATAPPVFFDEDGDEAGTCAECEGPFTLSTDGAAEWWIDLRCDCGTQRYRYGAESFRPSKVASHG